MRYLDACQTLQIESTASVEEATASYRRLVQMYHPDKGGDAERFREIVAAYKSFKVNHIVWQGVKPSAAGWKNPGFAGRKHAHQARAAQPLDAQEQARRARHFERGVREKVEREAEEKRRRQMKHILYVYILGAVLLLVRHPTFALAAGALAGLGALMLLPVLRRQMGSGGSLHWLGGIIPFLLKFWVVALLLVGIFYFRSNPI